MPPRDPAQLDALASLVRRLAHPDTEPDTSVAHTPAALVRKHLLAPLASRAGLARFHRDYIASSLMAEVRERTLAEVVAALSARSIPVILIKGISYAGTLYADPALRPMSDIDLMVPPTAHADAAHALRRLGYWRAGSTRQASRLHHAVCFKRKDAAIDLHRSIMQPWRSRIDIHALWRRARPAAERDDGALRLDPVDEAVLHLAHAARHELRVPVINYIDAARLLARHPGDPEPLPELLPELLVDRVLARSRQFRLGRAVAAAIAMTRALTQGEPLRWSVLPTARQVLSYAPVWRPLQLARKALLVQGPVELVGLLAAGIHGRVAHRFRS